MKLDKYKELVNSLNEFTGESFSIDENNEINFSRFDAEYKIKFEEEDILSLYKKVNNTWEYWDANVNEYGYNVFEEIMIENTRNKIEENKSNIRRLFLEHHKRFGTYPENMRLINGQLVVIDTYNYKDANIMIKLKAKNYDLRVYENLTFKKVLEMFFEINNKLEKIELHDKLLNSQNKNTEKAKKVKI